MSVYISVYETVRILNESDGTIISLQLIDISEHFGYFYSRTGLFLKDYKLTEISIYVKLLGLHLLFIFLRIRSYFINKK